MEFLKEKSTIDAIIAKAWDDATFKKNLIADPIKTLEAFFGRSLGLPATCEVNIIDVADKSKIYITIPDKKTFDDVELSEEQLDFVSGGNGIDKWNP